MLCQNCRLVGYSHLLAKKEILSVQTLGWFHLRTPLLEITFLKGWRVISRTNPLFA